MKLWWLRHSRTFASSPMKVVVLPFREPLFALKTKQTNENNNGSLPIVMDLESRPGFLYIPTVRKFETSSSSREKEGTSKNSLAFYRTKQEYIVSGSKSYLPTCQHQNHPQFFCWLSIPRQNPFLKFDSLVATNSWEKMSSVIRDFV